MADAKEKKNVKKRSRSEIVRRTIKFLESEKYMYAKMVLGRGTYGDVYMMYDLVRDSDVAVKIITSENTADVELAMWPKLFHPNIVPVIDVFPFRAEKVAVFVMPVQRKSLHDIMYDRRFITREDCLDFLKIWLFETLSALDYLDSRNLCHLDIKVDNILISHEYTAMLCDFSFLNFNSNRLKRYDLGLPYIYRPPEACHTLGNDIAIDGRAYDMWGFGIMTLEIFTHFVLATDIPDCKNWIKEVYPTLFNILQEKEFFTLMEQTFPGCNIDQSQAQLAMNFIHSFLMLKPIERSTAEEALQHQFLNNGIFLASLTDPIWTHEVYSKSVGLSSVKLWKKKFPKLEVGKIDEGEDRKIHDDDDTDDEYSTMSDSDDDEASDSSIECMHILIEKDNPDSVCTEMEQTNNRESLIEENSEPNSVHFSQMADASIVEKDEKNCCSLDHERNRIILSNDLKQIGDHIINKEFSISQSDLKILPKRKKKKCMVTKHSKLHRYPIKSKTLPQSSNVYISLRKNQPFKRIPDSASLRMKLQNKKIGKVGFDKKMTFYKIFRKNGVFPTNEEYADLEASSNHITSNDNSLKDASKEVYAVTEDTDSNKSFKKVKYDDPQNEQLTVENRIKEQELMTENSKGATGDTFSSESGDLVDLADMDKPSTSHEGVRSVQDTESALLKNEEFIETSEICETCPFIVNLNKTLHQVNELSGMLQSVTKCEKCNSSQKMRQQSNLESKLILESTPLKFGDSTIEIDDHHFDDATNVRKNMNTNHNDKNCTHANFSLDRKKLRDVNLKTTCSAAQMEIFQFGEINKETKPNTIPERCSNDSKRRIRWRKWIRNKCQQIECVVKCWPYKILE